LTSYNPEALGKFGGSPRWRS